MPCLLVLAAIFTIGAAQDWSSQPDSLGYYADQESGIEHNRGKYVYAPEAAGEQFNSGHYASAIEEGRPTKNCEHAVVSGHPDWFTKSPSKTKLFGPHSTNIQFLRVRPINSRDGLAKVWFGGVGHHYVILHFKTYRPNTFFDFTVTICY